MCRVCTEAVHSVALWTRVTLALDMCRVCTEAVHSVALWTRVTSPLWTYVALDQCKLWTPFGHFCPYFHTPYTLLCPKDEITFTFPRGLIWKIDNPSTTLSLAPGNFDNPYKGAESAGCLKLQTIYSKLTSLRTESYFPWPSWRLWGGGEGFEPEKHPGLNNHAWHRSKETWQ